MLSKASENSFLKGLALLSKEQQDKVLAYIESLLKRNGNTNHQKLLQLAGSIDAKSIAEIKAAIDAGCENIDANEW